jgi:hypothetical protein
MRSALFDGAARNDAVLTGTVPHTACATVPVLQRTASSLRRNKQQRGALYRARDTLAAWR